MLDPNEDEAVCDRWDQLLYQLSAQPRRQIIVSLLDAPAERRLLLPEAVFSPTSSTDAERLAIELEHRHLPSLADAGYVRWERDPLRVQRGPRFELAGAVVHTLLDSTDRLPWPLTGEDAVEGYGRT